MAQNLPEIGRLPNLGVKMDKNVYKVRSLSLKQGRLASLRYHLSQLDVDTYSSRKIALHQIFITRAVYLASSYRKKNPTHIQSN